MSGKSARATRQALRQFTFPALLTGHTIRRYRLDNRKPRTLIHKAEAGADHGRRIRHIAKSLGIRIEKAVEVYTKKMKMVAKPYFFDTEKRTYEMKQAEA